MDIEYKKNKEEENPTLEQKVKGDTEVKKYLVEYTGKKLNPKSGDVTVEMVVNTLCEEFPELVLVLAEENFFRGYRQAFSDIETTSEGFFELEKKDEQQ
jgi:TPP-dependent indolepyruvate ferredoxin oxidoreductase alpha subunit